MSTNEKAERLPGMPGPAEDSLKRRHEIEAALGRLHDVLLPMLEGLPSGEEAQGSISIRLKIQGDTVTVTLKPGSGE